MKKSGKPRDCSIGSYFGALQFGFYKLANFYYYLEASEVDSILDDCMKEVKRAATPQRWTGMRLLEYQSILFPMVKGKMRDKTDELQEKGRRISNWKYGQIADRVFWTPDLKKRFNDLFQTAIHSLPLP